MLCLFRIATKVCLALAVASLHLSCKNLREGRADTRPESVIECNGAQELLEWGSYAEGVYALDTDYRLWKWKWSNATLDRHRTETLPKLNRVLPIEDGIFAAFLYPGNTKAPWPFVLFSPSLASIEKWDTPDGWTYGPCGTSRNAKYSAILLHESLTSPPRNSDPDNPRYRIAIVDLKTRAMTFPIEHKGGDVYGDIRQVAVSDDGKRVAIAGWNNTVACFDADAKKMLWLWDSSGKGVINMGRAVFSSDGNVLTVGDSGGGGVYRLDAKSGKVLRRWLLGAEGDRVSCLAASPDDTLIAAGMTGDVYLLDVNSDKRKAWLPHGDRPILGVSFSPDGSRLVSLGEGLLKIWRVGGP